MNLEDHFLRLSALLEIEAKEEADRARKRAESMGPKAAEEAGYSLVDLRASVGESAPGGLFTAKFEKRSNQRLPWTRVGPGDPVVISNPEAAPRRGVVYAKKANHVTVAFSEAFSHDGPHRLDLSTDEVTTQRQLAALASAMTGGGRLGRLREVLLGRTPPEFQKLEATEIPGLLEAQQKAAQLVLHSKDVALIHGPPGTGKTRTLAAALAEATRRGDTVLACAPSNLAVDNLMERLIAEDVAVVRLGHPARVLPELAKYTLIAQSEAHDDSKLAKKLFAESTQLFIKSNKEPKNREARARQHALRREAKDLRRDARRLWRRATERVLNQADAVLATTSFDPDLLSGRRFDIAAIDEAAQSTEPGSWPPILFAERVILAGDHQQLPPTVLSKDAAAQGFSISLFERLMNMLPAEASQRLDVQHRMHAEIMKFPSEHMYDGSLIAHPAVAGHQIEIGDTPLTPFELVDTSGSGFFERQSKTGDSRSNREEANYVVKRVEGLRRLGVAAQDIGVITPYAAQARLLRERLSDDAIEVDTVDGFQGREKDAIVVSLVRSNNRQDIGFLADVRRMNVAMTRARKHLLVVGDGATVGAHAFYAALWKSAEDRGVLRSVFEDLN